MVGSSDLIASVEDSYSIFSEFTDVWRTEADLFVKSGEGRFIDEAGYMPLMQEAISELMKNCSLSARAISQNLSSRPRRQRACGSCKKLGFDPSLVQDPLFTLIGNTGYCCRTHDAGGGPGRGDARGTGSCSQITAMAAMPSFSRVTEKIARVRTQADDEREAGEKKGHRLRDLSQLARPRAVRGIKPSGTRRALACQPVEGAEGYCIFEGVKCRNCGTPQIHPFGQAMRICVACQSKDTFEEYKFSDKKGKLFTYAVDHLQPTKNPPGLNGVIDFDGGGRLICELTDYDLDRVKIGMPVEMTFRRLFQGKGIVNYFWKAKPLEGDSV